MRCKAFLLISFALCLNGCASTRQFVGASGSISSEARVTVSFKRVFAGMGAAGPIHVLDRGPGAAVIGHAALMRPEAVAGRKPFGFGSPTSVLFIGIPVRVSPSTPSEHNSLMHIEGSNCTTSQDEVQGTVVSCNVLGGRAAVVRRAGPRNIELLPLSSSFAWHDVSVIASVAAGDTVTWTRQAGTMTIDVVAGMRYVSSKPIEVKAGHSYRIEWEILSETVEVVDVTNKPTH